MTTRTNAFLRGICITIGICALAACSGDPVCGDAEAHVLKCLPKGSGAAPETTPESAQACEGVYACTSKCVLDAPCKGLTNEDMDAGTAYLECTKKCSPDAGPEDGGS